jgi:sulfur-carrier protein
LAGVRLFAALREIAGTSRLELPGTTVEEVVAAASAKFGERFAQVSSVSSFVVNGQRAEPATPVVDSDEVAILPPVSGGGFTRRRRS